MTEHIATFLMLFGGIATLALLSMEIRHTDRFGKDRGPMPRRTRYLLMWIILIAGASSIAWEMHRGNTNFFMP
jgi:hypothetical protein